MILKIPMLNLEELRHPLGESTIKYCLIIIMYNRCSEFITLADPYSYE